MLGPLTICRHGVAAGAAGVAQGAGAARLSGAGAARRCSGASCASCCGTSPTIRAASCAGASARSGASSTSPVGAGSTPRRDTVRLDLADCFVDAIEIARAAQEHRDARPGAAASARRVVRRRLSRRPGDRPQPGLQRLAHRAAAPVPRLSRGAAGAPRQDAPDDEVLGYLEKWLELAPFDQRVHELLLNALARRGRIREGEEHLAATARLFEAEGLDSASDARCMAVGQGAGETVAPSVRTAVPDAAAAAGSRRDDDRHRRTAPRLHRGDAVRRPIHRDGRPRRGCRRARPRRDHPARQAAQPVRHRAGDACSPCTSGASAPEEAGRMLNVDYVVSGSVRRQGRRLTVTVELAETRTARIVWAESLRPQARRRVPRPRRDRQPDRRVDRQRDRDRRAQPRHPAAAELARRVGGASPRPVAHVPVQQARQRAGPAFLRDGGAPRSDLRARLCRPVLHAFPERLPGLGEARAGNRPGLRGRRPKPHGRRSRPRRALGDGPGAVAARPP